MRRLIAIFLALALALCLCPAASAEEPFSYELRDGGVWITGANAGGDLTIPAEIDGVPVVGLADAAFYNNESITSVTLPEGLRQIGAHVFTGCAGIRGTLQIPDSVEFIEPWSLGILRYSGKFFSAADRYRWTSPAGGENFQSTGALPGWSEVREGGMVFWLRGGEAELVSVEYGSGSVLTVPATVQGCPVTAIGPCCCCSIDPLYGMPQHVVVPGTVRRLREHAFQSVRLKSLYLAEGVQTLEPWSLAADQETAVVVPASARDVTGPLYKRYRGVSPPTVYAYGDSEAARLAEAEGCTLVRRDAADGRSYGLCGGMQYYIQDGEITIYGGRVSPPFYEAEVQEIPDHIDGLPVTGVVLSVFSGSRQILIPPGVTSLICSSGDLLSSDLLLYYPGTFAERFCKANALNSGSIFSYWAPPFDDVRADSWYYDAVCYVYGTRLMLGTGSMLFSPNAQTSRAMLVTVLWRMAGAAEPDTGCPFDDVPAGSWYESAVCWAYAAGVTRGVSETAFAPDAPVTREQIAALLLRYAQLQGMPAGGRAEIDSYPDADAVSDWACDAMQWAREMRIIKGRLRDGDVFLDPGANARRCEIAEMLMRFCLNAG